MCLVKTPKLKTDPNADKPKDPTIIRNPYLDGVGPSAKANRQGRSSLRISRTSASASGGIQPTAPPLAVSRPGPLPPLSLARPGSSSVQGGGGRISRTGTRMSPNAY